MSDPDFDDLVQAVWVRNRESVAERLDVLAAAADRLANGHSDLDLGPAQVAAHRLSGSLGAFGFPWASEVALGLHRLLEQQTNGKGDRLASDEVGRRLGHLVERLREMLPLRG